MPRHGTSTHTWMATRHSMQGGGRCAPLRGGVGARNHRAKFAKVAFAYQQVVNVLEVNVEDHSAQGRAHVTERRYRAMFGIPRARGLADPDVVAHVRRHMRRATVFLAESALEAAANVSVTHDGNPDAASSSDLAPPAITGYSMSPVIEVLGQVTLATIKHAAARLMGAATGSAGSIPPRVYMPASDGVIEEWLRFEG